MRGIEIAKKLKISTSALRHYEAWGLIPEVERTANGYRNYTKIHEAYFQCIRSMNDGFGMDLIKKDLPHIKNGQILDALWLINKAQVTLHEEKETAQKIFNMLELTELTKLPKYNHKKMFTIGEVAKQTYVTASAIRHWEKEGLINPERHNESGFRMYSSSDIRKILIIRTDQRAAYSLDIVREVLSKFDNNNVVQIKQIVQESLHYIDNALLNQTHGIASVYNLLNVISSIEEP